MAKHVEKISIDIDVNVEHNVLETKVRLERIKREANFSQVVLTGITAIQKNQRALAPGSRNIARSIRPARVIREGAHSWSATTRTNYAPAIFTNEGTGLHGPKASKYNITQRRVYKSGPRRGNEYEVNISHPGVRGTHWWERGIEAGSPLALETFKRKIDRMLRD